MTVVPGLALSLGNPMTSFPGYQDFAQRAELAYQNGGTIIGDSFLEGKYNLVVSLWKLSSQDYRLVSAFVISTEAGEEEFTILGNNANPWVQMNLLAWKYALLNWIDQSFDENNDSVALEVEYYTTMTDDFEVLDEYLGRLTGVLGWSDCGAFPYRGGCHDCCSETGDGKRAGCGGAGVLAGFGACAIAAGCGPSWGVCCAIGGQITKWGVDALCSMKVGRSERMCHHGCDSKPKEPGSP